MFRYAHPNLRRVRSEGGLQSSAGEKGAQFGIDNDTQANIGGSEHSIVKNYVNRQLSETKLDDSQEYVCMPDDRSGIGAEARAREVPKELVLSNSDVEFVDLEAGAKIYKMSPYEVFNVDLAEIGDQARLADANNVDKDWVGQYFADDPAISFGYVNDYLDDNGDGKVYLYEATADSAVRMIVNNKPSHGSSDFTGQSKADAVRNYLALKKAELSLGDLPLMNALSERGYIYKGSHSTDVSGNIEGYEIVIGTASLKEQFTIRQIKMQEYRRFELKS